MEDFESELKEDMTVYDSRQGDIKVVAKLVKNHAVGIIGKLDSLNPTPQLTLLDRRTMEYQQKSLEIQEQSLKEQQQTKLAQRRLSRTLSLVSVGF